MIYFFYFLHVLISLFLIMVVLLQQGKGADLSVFGGGGTMTAFGARGAATLLHKMTVGAFVGFIITTLVIGVLQGQGSRSTVMSGIEIEEETQQGTEDVEAPAALLEEDDPAGDTMPADGAEDGSVDMDGADADAAATSPASTEGTADTASGEDPTSN